MSGSDVSDAAVVSAGLSLQADNANEIAMANTIFFMLIPFNHPYSRSKMIKKPQPKLGF
jgi:hypothetical protein